MNIARVVAVAMLFVAALAACSVDPVDEKSNLAQCLVNAKTSCRITFRHLAEQSSKVDCQLVRVEGYLGVSRGLFVLYSSKELFEAGVNDEVALRLRGPVDVQEKIFDQFAYSWVSVTGTYRAKPGNGTTDDLLLGELHAPLQFHPLRLPMPVERETFDDVILDLQDIN